MPSNCKACTRAFPDGPSIRRKDDITGRALPCRKRSRISRGSTRRTSQQNRPLMLRKGRRLHRQSLWPEGFAVPGAPIRRTPGYPCLRAGEFLWIRRKEMISSSRLLPPRPATFGKGHVVVVFFILRLALPKRGLNRRRPGPVS